MLVNGARLVPDPLGGLYWPAEATLVVSDLHLEKGSSFARRGSLLPPYDTRATLEGIEALVARHAPERIVCLGDSFHDPEAGERLDAADRDSIRALTAAHEWIWILGNHDPEPPDGLGGTAMHELEVGPLRFRHEPAVAPAPGEIAGHLHPRAALSVRGRTVARRCFVGDGLRLVLPAFGAYTGGLDVRDPAFGSLFPGAFQAWMLGRRGVRVLDSRRLGCRP